MNRAELGNQFRPLLLTKYFRESRDAGKSPDLFAVSQGADAAHRRTLRTARRKWQAAEPDVLVRAALGRSRHDHRGRDTARRRHDGYDAEAGGDRLLRHRL